MSNGADGHCLNVVVNVAEMRDDVDDAVVVVADGDGDGGGC